METTRFETFIDAIIAIIITVLVLKIPQPATPTLGGVLKLNGIYIAYLISFLILFNVWYNNHNLFQLIDTIDNTTVWIYGIMTFVVSLLPYFTIWLANNMYSIPAETMFGVNFVVMNILYLISLKTIYRCNPYNEKIKILSKIKLKVLIPIIICLIGFVLTYTVYVPGIYVCCLIAAIIWIFIGSRLLGDVNGN